MILVEDVVELICLIKGRMIAILLIRIPKVLSLSILVGFKELFNVF